MFQGVPYASPSAPGVPRHADDQATTGISPSLRSPPLVQRRSRGPTNEGDVSKGRATGGPYSFPKLKLDDRWTGVYTVDIVIDCESAITVNKDHTNYIIPYFYDYLPGLLGYLDN